jgi:hypothetical protein
VEDVPTDEQAQTISNALTQGNTIEAIKLYRAATGKGLKEAKDFIASLKTELQPVAKPIPTQKDIYIRVIVFLALLMLSGGLTCVVASFRCMSLGKQSENWPSTQGTITSVRTRKEMGQSAYISYTYGVDGTYYIGNRYAYRPAEQLRYAYRGYKTRQAVTVYYDPEKPKRAVLTPGFRPYIVLPILGIVCLIITIILANLGIKTYRTKDC